MNGLLMQKVGAAGATAFYSAMVDAGPVTRFMVVMMQQLDKGQQKKLQQQHHSNYFACRTAFI
jgi:hypothetical protein